MLMLFSFGAFINIWLQSLLDSCLHHKRSAMGAWQLSPASLLLQASFSSFLGVHPSECQKYTEKTCISPRTFTHACAILPSFPGMIRLLPGCCRRLQRLHPTCVCDPHCLHFHLLILGASTARLHPCSSISSFFILVLHSEKDVKGTFYISSCSSSLCSTPIR